MKFQTRLRNDKGQVEMVGLVVIVILVALGLLFMALFVMNEKPTKKIFTRKGLAYSSMSAVLKTTINDTQCVDLFAGQTYPQIGKDLLEDCAGHKETEPDGNSMYRCGGKHSCVFLNETISHLFELTLGEWRKNYEFESRLLGYGDVDRTVTLLHITRGRGCPASRERDTSGLFPLNTEYGLVENTLYLCD